jgi:hypothetical protein
MSAGQLDQPIVSPTALRTVNFFNGRLLTGDDLKLEQATQGARIERLGRAAGEGVAYGLEVTRARTSGGGPVVTVAPGLAVARSGVALELSSQVEIALEKSVEVVGTASADAGFHACEPVASDTYQAGAGVYLLVIGPARQGEGRAQAGGLTGSGPCTVARTVEAVTFRLIRLVGLSDELRDMRLVRNRIAYDCFGIRDTGRQLIDPFSQRAAQWGLIDTLRPQASGASALLCDDEVPLATIGSSVDTGIEFVDMWSVRRRPTRPPAEGSWVELAGDRRRAEAEAMFLQFQAQLDELVNAGPSPELVMARNHFEWLPPVGLLPVGLLPAGLLPAGLLPVISNPRKGFDLSTFFDGMTINGPLLLEGAKAERVFLEALGTRPITPLSGTPMWLYLVREALDPSAWDGATPGGFYVLFTSGELPYAGNAQYDVARWDYANYAITGD